MSTTALLFALGAALSGAAAAVLQNRGANSVDRSTHSPIALLVTIFDDPPRMPEGPQSRKIAGVDVSHAACNRHSVVGKPFVVTAQERDIDCRFDAVLP